MRSHTKTQTGFTIVELLIVVVVIAILAAITVVAYNGIRQRAETSARHAELSQLQRKIQTDVLQMNGTSISISAPIAYAIGIGNETLSSPLVSAQEVTIYGVIDTPNNPAAAGWSTMVGMNPNGTNNSLRLRTGASSDNTARGFYATSAQTNRDITQNNILNTTARHIGWISATADRIYSNYDSNAGGGTALTAHTGWNFESVTLHSGAAFTPVAALVFAEYHDETTRTQVINWLNAEYNVGL